MIGSYLGEYALSYNPTRHGKPGLGASKGSAKAWIKNKLKQFLYYL